MHSLGAKSDGRIVAWGAGPGAPPEPNTDFVAAAGGEEHSLGLKSRRVARLLDAELNQGAHEVRLDLRRAGSNDRRLPAGVYYIVLRFNGRAEGKRIIVIP